MLRCRSPPNPSLSKLASVLYEHQSALFVKVAVSERKEKEVHISFVRTLSVGAVDRPDVVVCALVHFTGNFFLPHDPFRE